MVAAHPLGSLLQGGALVIRQARKRRLELVARQFELGHRGDIELIETAGVFDDRRITARLDAGKDLGDRILDACVGSALECQQAAKRIEKAGIERIELTNDAHLTAPSKASSTGWIISRLVLSEA